MMPSVVALAAHGTVGRTHTQQVNESVDTMHIALSREIAMLASYVDTQMSQEREQRTVRLDVSPGALEAKVPTMFLQLLVANVLWQLRRTGGSGSVEVSADREGNELHLGMRIVMPFLEKQG